MLFSAVHPVARATHMAIDIMTTTPKRYCRFGANIVNMKRPPIKISKVLLESVCKKSLEMNSADPEAAILLGAFYVLMMDFAKSWPVSALYFPCFIKNV